MKYLQLLSRLPGINPIRQQSGNPDSHPFVEDALLNSFHQIRYLQAQSVGDDLQGLDRNIRLSAFDLAHVSSVESGAIGEGILRIATLFP
jgi:hypothetical protein